MFSTALDKGMGNGFSFGNMIKVLELNKTKNENLFFSGITTVKFSLSDIESELRKSRKMNTLR